MAVATNRPPRNRSLVLWVIWAAITFELPMLQFALGGGLPSGDNRPGEPFPIMAIIAIGTVLVATLIRWLVLVRLTQFKQQLVTMVIGLVLAEAAGFFEIFLVPQSQPETKFWLFLLALLGVVQFAPVYASER